ncbi:hypothetical protein G9A89_010565 [Geosiphon pyriformis]|nr:hypothetical protein G9A89_010565 [Geosiphon pyriformis]
MPPQQFFSALSHDIGSLFNSLKFSDVRIVVGEVPNIRTFNVHSQILAARSSYFAKALFSDWVKGENDIIVFSKPNISTQIFEVTLRYIYTGEISLNEHGVFTILELLIVADELVLEQLIDHLEDYLIEYHAKELEENFITVHERSLMHHSFKKLQNFCTEIAVKNPAAVFNSKDFTSLNKNALSSILSLDHLNMEESEIWGKIVEWGLAKLSNPIQLEQVLNWTDENFEAFKESIEELLPLIQFFNISSVDFYYKVKPFARILPGTLYEDLLHHYLVPGSHPHHHHHHQTSVDAQPSRFSRLNIESKLLQPHNVKQLDHWIQGKDENTPFQNRLGNHFKLLLRGSRDGFSPNDFHSLCDDKGATVTVIKVKGTGQLIGGYSPESWHSYIARLNGDGSFIFSLGDGKAQDAKLGKFVSGLANGFRPLSHQNYGPHFGKSIETWSSNFESFSSSCLKEPSYDQVIMPGSENEPVPNSKFVPT